jgi:asparagine synthase (glutamine-hydrolysing)
METALVCGISGIITAGRVTPESRASVARMSDALAHRGPDGAGEYAGAHVALAMRRLSIIDLEGGRQPLFNEDGSVALIVNGEIYNYVELRARLEADGHRFKSGSDCETIVHLYEKHGLDFVHHLRGMFALALWDEARRRLVLARDRMGEKPLYLYESDGRLIFASELKALLRSGVVPFELDAEAVNLYFHYQYVPEPKTPLKGVRKLDAAHMLVVEVEPWRTRELCYWRMEDAPPLEGDPAALIREQLEEAGELVVRSDVPVGVALSGGLDSSAVAALAARKYPGKLHAFSVGYEGRPASDERAEAEALARRLGMPFHEVELDARTVVDFFPALNYWRDDPVADISGFGYYAVMRRARECGVPVMLQGQGGDELFWGYPQLRQAAVESLQKESARGRPPLAALLQYLSVGRPTGLSRREVSDWARGLGGAREGLRRYRRHRAAPPDRLAFYDISLDFAAASEEMHALYSVDFNERLAGRDAAELFTLAPPWTHVEVTLTRLVCATYLRENGITQGDRLGMASSVEMRLPLVDHRLVETVIGLRKSHSDARLPPKTWLREAVKDLLPADVLARPKQGFAPPTLEWHEALFAAYGGTLRDGYLVQNGVLTREGGERLSGGAFPASATSPLSFKALVLEHWCRQMTGLL